MEYRQNKIPIEEFAQGKFKVVRPIKREYIKPKRNKPCLCGSEVKYKKCCWPLYD